MPCLRTPFERRRYRYSCRIFRFLGKSGYSLSSCNGSICYETADAAPFSGCRGIYYFSFFRGEVDQKFFP